MSLRNAINIRITDNKWTNPSYCLLGMWDTCQGMDSSSSLCQSDQQGKYTVIISEIF